MIITEVVQTDSVDSSKHYQTFGHSIFKSVTDDVVIAIRLLARGRHPIVKSVASLGCIDRIPYCANADAKCSRDLWIAQSLRAEFACLLTNLGFCRIHDKLGPFRGTAADSKYCGE